MDYLKALRDDPDLAEEFDSLFDFFLLDDLSPRDEADGRATFTLPGMAFARDGSGGEYHLLEDGSIGYYSSEGEAGRLAESMDDLFSLIVSCICWHDCCDAKEYADSKTLEEYGQRQRNINLEDMDMDSWRRVADALGTYKMTARDLARTIILDILKTTGITAAAGMGPNLYLAKIAMDIVAKHVHPDKDGVRIAKLNEMTYRQLLWTHRPLTDFWRIGRGYATKLEAHGLYTMGDIARCSIGKPTDYHNEEMLYRLFGVNAELLIDHAWGWEPCTIADVKAYKPENKSIVSGQVLQCPYSFDKARLVVREMADALALDLVDKGLVTNQLVLTVGYDIENLVFTQGTAAYTGAVTTDRYGRKIPKHAVGTENFSYTSSANDLLEAVTTLYDRIVDRTLLIRRLSISANRLLREDEAPKQDETEQLDLFTDYVAREEQQAEYEAEHARERKIQKTMLRIKKKFGKNAILKGMNLEDGATARERNQTIGGHQA